MKTRKAFLSRLFVIILGGVSVAGKAKGVGFGIWDPQPVLDYYNNLIKEDNIDTTPTCVVIKDGRKKAFIGDLAIISAIRALP